MAVRLILLVLLIMLMHIYCMQSMKVTLRVLEACYLMLPCLLCFLVLGSIARYP